MATSRRSSASSDPARDGCTERCCRRRLELRPGDVFRLDRRASVQFGGERELLFRLTSVSHKSGCHGWVWLTGYELGPTGEALARREVFVQLAGLQPARLPVSNARPGRAGEQARGAHGGSAAQD
ncbi:hypothetical protein ACFQ0D_32085, partial [Micromonospora zhanjiangensis]